MQKPRTPLQSPLFLQNPTSNLVIKTHSPYTVCKFTSHCVSILYIQPIIYISNVQAEMPPMFPTFSLLSDFGNALDQQYLFYCACRRCAGFGPSCEERREEARRLHRVWGDLSRSDKRWYQRLLSSSFLHIGAEFSVSSSHFEC